MPLTPNFSIYYRDTSSPASLETESALQADSVDDALTLVITGNRQIQTFRWADATARAAQTGMVAGDVGYQVDMGVQYQYTGSTWAALDAFALLEKNGTTFSVPNAAFTQVTDTYLTTAASRGVTVSGGAVTVLTSGRYRVTASALFTAAANGSRQVDVTKNSASAGTNDVLSANVAGSAVVNGTVAASKTLVLAAGDVLRFFVYQNSGSSLALGTGGQTAGTFFHVEAVGAA